MARTIEDTLKSHPIINDCCCVKYDDPEEREVPVAHIVLENDKYSEDIVNELDALIRSKCPEIYVPKYYVVRKDIPITEVNKKVDFKTLENEDIFENTNNTISQNKISNICFLLKRWRPHEIISPKVEKNYLPIL